MALRVLVIGLGLIGASFAKAIKNQNQAFVLGFDLNSESILIAKEQGIIDEAVFDLPAAVETADVIQIAVPVLAIGKVVNLIAPHLKQGVILTDVGSVKSPFVAACKNLPDSIHVVPAHPIAGAEKSGVMAANDALFRHHQVIVTPVSDNSEAVELVAKLWRSTGATVVSMTVEHHDEVLASTSHLPHLLAFSLVDTLNRNSENREIFNYAAGGFRDFTRIAASDPTMWRDICLANKHALLSSLDLFVDDLADLRAAIVADDGDELHRVFGQAKEARDHFSEILKNRQNSKEG